MVLTPFLREGKYPVLGPVSIRYPPGSRRLVDGTQSVTRSGKPCRLNSTTKQKGKTSSLETKLNT